MSPLFQIHSASFRVGLGRGLSPIPSLNWNSAPFLRVPSGPNPSSMWGVCLNPSCGPLGLSPLGKCVLFCFVLQVWTDQVSLFPL